MTWRGRVYFLYDSYEGFALVIVLASFEQTALTHDLRQRVGAFRPIQKAVEVVFERQAEVFLQE